MLGSRMFLVLLSYFGTSSGSPLNISGTVEEDAILTTPQLIEKYGYPVEVLHIQTEDGYILEVHRIPHGIAQGAGPQENKSKILVIHGLCDSSADMVITGPKNALGYLLADRGYDVWLGNVRGNKYSRKHISLSPEDGEFWDFSWHEMGIYDLPAIIDHMTKNNSQEKIFYVGHSQGTTAFYVMGSMKPEYNRKIRAMFSMAPIAYMYHMTSPFIKMVAYYDGSIELLFNLIGIHEFMPRMEILELIPEFAELFCSNKTISQLVCSNYMFLMFGYNDDQFNHELFPVIVGQLPAGSATKQMLHYSQNIKYEDQFRLYDYGLVKNMIKYNKPIPPSYNISKITASVALFSSHNDWLAAEVDVEKLYEDLPNPIGLFMIDDPNFNHMDYLWAKDVVTLVYDKIFDLMTKY